MFGFYMDIGIGTAPRRAQPASRGSGIGITVMARVALIVHGVIRRQGEPLAIALPRMRTGEYCHPGDVLRVFARTREAVDWCAEAIEAHTTLREYVMVGRCRTVPSEHPGDWVEYRRYRIPGRSSRLTINRANRLRAGDKLPYLQVASRSTAQPFSLRVQPLRHSGPLDGQGEHLPDSYGLSLPSRPLALPDLAVL